MGTAQKIWNVTKVAETLSSEIPSSSLIVDHSLSLPQMKPHIMELFKDLFKQWSDLDESDFSLETVSGGITNLLLTVSVREKDGSVMSTTVRLYGPNTEYVIDRERELQAIPHLSAAGFGAKLLGVFGNGMVQSFIDARTLTPSDMRKPKLVAEIAKELKRFHEHRPSSFMIAKSKRSTTWFHLKKSIKKSMTSRQWQIVSILLLYTAIMICFLGI